MSNYIDLTCDNCDCVFGYVELAEGHALIHGMLYCDNCWSIDMYNERMKCSLSMEEDANG